MPPVDLATHPQLGIYAEHIQECAAELGIDPLVIAALAMLESSGRPDAYNPHSMATGLMGIRPREAGPVFRDRPTIAELRSPFVNIQTGCQILREYLDLEDGNLEGALRRYSGYRDKPLEDFQANYLVKFERELAKLREGQPMATTTTERFVRAAEQEFGPDGFEDLRAKLPDNPQKPYWAIDSRTMPNIVIHHSTGPINATWSGIWKDHRFTVNPKAGKPWPGIGYHLGIRLGKVALLGSLDTIRAHVKGLNDKGLGICVVGDYDKRDIPPENITALKRLIYVLDSVYETPKALRWHAGGELGMLPASYSACPGSALRRLVPSLRSDMPSKTPPVTTGRLVEVSEETLHAILWSVEEARREFARGEMAEADNRYRDLVEFPLKQLLART